MIAHLFPGQGAQFPGMGADVYKHSFSAKSKFEKANDILGFRLSEIMFKGSVEELKQTRVTQPAIFIHSVALAMFLADSMKPEMMAGHSLGEFSALVASKSLTLDAGLRLVKLRAEAMQRACENTNGTMAAVLKLDDATVEQVCKDVDGIVVPANYNSPGQLVISGERAAVETAAELLKEAGGRAVVLKVAGAFHSKLMNKAYNELSTAIDAVEFAEPFCPIYQNGTAQATQNPEELKKNLKEHMVSPVYWTKTIANMIQDGADEFVEIGPGKVLQGLVKKIAPEVGITSLDSVPKEED
ncbi:MAG: ACP S-malonyltransferase [Saprospiraceae bacterium]|nr:ACP S-malonyltransferase [Saprospiraceae bacterium]